MMYILRDNTTTECRNKQKLVFKCQLGSQVIIDLHLYGLLEKKKTGVGLIPQWRVCGWSFPLVLCGIDSTMTCLWLVVPPGAVWDWFHSDLSVMGRSPWCCVGLIPQWRVCDGSFPLELCGIDSTMTCLWLVVPPGAVWDWFHNDVSDGSFPLVLCGIDSTMTCLWWVVPSGAVWDWFHNDLSVMGRSLWSCVGLIPQWPVCGWSFPLELCGIDSTMTCLWLVVPPGAVWDWFHNDLSVIGRSPWSCVGLIPQWPVCGWSFPLVLCGIDSTMTCLWWVVPSGVVWDWFHNDLSVIGRSPWCCVGLIPQWPVCDGSFPLVLCGIDYTMTRYVIGRSPWCCVGLIPQWPVCDGSFPLVLCGIDSTMTCLWLVVPPGAVWDWFHNDLSVMGRSPWCCVGLIPQWPVCGRSPWCCVGLIPQWPVCGRSLWFCMGLIPQWPVCDWSFPLPSAVLDWFHNDLSVIGRYPWCCVGLIPQWPVCGWSFPLVLCGIDSTMTCLWWVVPPSVLARIWIFSKKELLKFFRELFAKERSYPFHGKNVANVYQIRVLYARTCRNHLVNRRFRTL